MQFGKVSNPAEIDFTLPADHPQTTEVLQQRNATGFKDVRVGCAKWNKKDLKNFYPKGVKDELEYYSSQFNSIELNASFYRMFPAEQFKKWEEKAAQGFKFFPKIPRFISHIRRLRNAESQTDEFVGNVLSLKEKLGSVFLQMPENFHAKNIDALEGFLKHWPQEIPLAVELRHAEWFQEGRIADELNDLFQKYNVSNILTDSAGRRDLLHMKLTNTTVFIRYVGANDESDYSRLDDWLERIEQWHKMGLKNLYFFVHQNVEVESPLLSAYFIEEFNKKFKTDIQIPKTFENATTGNRSNS